MSLVTSFILTTAGIFLFLVSKANSEEAPNTGLLYNKKEIHSLNYHCQQNIDKTLNCEFIEISVRSKAKPDNLNSKLIHAREEFKAGVTISDEECKLNKQLNDVLEGKIAAPREEGSKELTEVQKTDFRKMTKM